MKKSINFRNQSRFGIVFFKILNIFSDSNERFNTGVEEIDELYASYQTVVHDANTGLDSMVANVESVDTIADNFTIETVGDNILDFSEGNPFGEGEDWL